MHEPITALVSGWETFYVIIGSSAAALTGLMFVVIALTGEARRGGLRPTVASIRAFATPIVVHFGGVLLLAGLLTTPQHTVLTLSLSLAGCGVAGLGFVRWVFIQTRRQQRIGSGMSPSPPLSTGPCSSAPRGCGGVPPSRSRWSARLRSSSCMSGSGTRGTRRSILRWGRRGCRRSRRRVELASDEPPHERERRVGHLVGHARFIFLSNALNLGCACSGVNRKDPFTLYKAPDRAAYACSSQSIARSGSSRPT